MDGLVSWLREFLLSGPVLLMVAMVAGIGLLELMMPARPVPARHYAFNLAYSFATYAVQAALQPLIGGAMAALIRKLGVGLIDLQALGFGGIGGAVLAMLVAAVVFDFFFYWMHRFEHSNPILWQEHLVHHSDQSLNVTSSSRSHFLDAILIPIFVSVPMAVLFKLPPITIGLLTLVPFAWTHFVHANLKLGFGPLWWLLVSPSYHRIHHSLETQHIDKNFATWFPVWDILFGTAVRPTRGHHPATGVAGVSIQSLWHGLAFPFIGWIAMARGGRTTASPQPAARQPTRRRRT